LRTISGTSKHRAKERKLRIDVPLRDMTPTSEKNTHPCPKGDVLHEKGEKRRCGSAMGDGFFESKVMSYAKRGKRAGERL